MAMIYNENLKYCKKLIFPGNRTKIGMCEFDQSKIFMYFYIYILTAGCEQVTIAHLLFTILKLKFNI